MPQFIVKGVDRESGFDTELKIDAESEANARVKAELKGVVVTDVSDGRWAAPDDAEPARRIVVPKEWRPAPKLQQATAAANGLASLVRFIAGVCFVIAVLTTLVGVLGLVYGVADAAGYTVFAFLWWIGAFGFKYLSEYMRARA